MDDEFSLGEYLSALRRRWYVALIALLATLVLGVIYNALQDARYRAQVVLAAEPAKYVWRLDQAFQSVAEDLRLDRRADYTALIAERVPGMKLAEQVIAKLGAALPPKLRDPETLWELVEVKNGRGRVLYLEASAPSAMLARLLANTWAEVLIGEVGSRYGQASDLGKFQAALREAQDKLSTARRAVEDSQARSGLSLELGAQMTTLQEGALAAGLTPLQQRIVLKSSELAEYGIALDHVRTLKERAIAAQTEGSTLSVLPLELLDTPLLTQRGQVTRPQVNAMNGDLGQLVSALADEETSLAQTNATLQAEIDRLQAELAAQIQERNSLLREFNMADEAVRALQRKVTEISLQEAIAGRPLVVLGEADKVSPRWLINLILAGAVGVLGGILLAFAVDLWRRKV